MDKKYYADSDVVGILGPPWRETFGEWKRGVESHGVKVIDNGNGSLTIKRDPALDETS